MDVKYRVEIQTAIWERVRPRGRGFNKARQFLRGKQGGLIRPVTKLNAQGKLIDGAGGCLG